MARFDTNGLDRLVLDLTELANIPEDTLSQMLNEEADIIAAGQKEMAYTMGVFDTGATQAAIVKGPVKKTRYGDRCIYVYPRGEVTRNGRTYRLAERAFINEFGRRGQPARPFIAEANNKYIGTAVNAAVEILDAYIDKCDL